MLFVNTAEGVSRWGEMHDGVREGGENQQGLEFDWLKCLPTPTCTPSFRGRCEVRCRATSPQAGRERTMGREIYG